MKSLQIRDEHESVSTEEKSENALHFLSLSTFVNTMP